MQRKISDIYTLTVCIYVQDALENPYRITMQSVQTMINAN